MKFQVSIHNEQAHEISLKGIKELTEKVWQTESKDNARLTIILVDDTYIKKLNKDYLNKNSVTDVISFPLSNETDMFEGEIYISMDRVLENASIYNVESGDELERMAVHGVLHFLGYKDKSDIEKQAMTARENYYLSL
ncbi:rRNA maturation RNase YbeY [candidate division KSB1 bacterium]|nr:rRNA maturation RNase YbeY [candidate division KSB1 bacterium]